MATQLGTNLYQVLPIDGVPSINANAAIVANFSRLSRYTNGNPLSWRRNINSPLTSLAKDDLFSGTATSITSDLDTTFSASNKGSSGSTVGPLVNIPVTANQTAFILTGVTLGTEDELYRNGSAVSKSAYSLIVNGGNTSVTLSAGESPVTTSEALDFSSWQYQNNSN